MESLSKSQLAWQYSPNVAQNTALNRLNRWINGDRELLTKLKRTGYTQKQRILTIKQIAIIYEYLGCPVKS